MEETKNENVDVKKMNIYEKMGRITEEMGVVIKGLEVSVTKTTSYKAVSERDVLDAVKPLEIKYRVYSYPIERSIVDADLLKEDTDYGTKTRLFMRVATKYRFVNMDKPEEYVDIDTYGDGIDSGDKAPGKAMTYGDKYALLKAYKISTGDDPDKDPSPEGGYDLNNNEKKFKKEYKTLGGNNTKATAKQLEMLKGFEFNEPKFLEYYKVEKLEDLTIQQASDAISKLKGDK